MIMVIRNHITDCLCMGSSTFIPLLSLLLCSNSSINNGVTTFCFYYFYYYFYIPRWRPLPTQDSERCASIKNNYFSHNKCTNVFASSGAGWVNTEHSWHCLRTQYLMSFATSLAGSCAVLAGLWHTAATILVTYLACLFVMFRLDGFYSFWINLASACNQ